MDVLRIHCDVRGAPPFYHSTIVHNDNHSCLGFFVQELGIIPVIGLDFQSGDLQDTVDIVEYLFGGADTAWGAVRVRDGHPEPYGSVWFQFGNEGTTKAKLSVCADKWRKIAPWLRVAEHPSLRS